MFHSKKEVEKTTFNFSGPLRPGKVSHSYPVPEHIKRPEYAKSGIPISEQKIKSDKIIPVYDDEDIEGIKLACKIGR